LIPLAEQQEQLQIYATGLGLSCDEILIEQNFSLATILLERTEGRHLVEKYTEWGCGHHNEGGMGLGKSRECFTAAGRIQS